MDLRPGAIVDQDLALPAVHPHFEDLVQTVFGVGAGIDNGELLPGSFLSVFLLLQLAAAICGRIADQHTNLHNDSLLRPGRSST
ncbi:hypothetical protein D3C76_1504330 [compost metagenome]